MIESGQIDNWKSISNLLNEQLRNDESEYRDESAYRKPYQSAKGYYEDVFLPMMQGDEYLNQVREAKDELYKIKRQVSDQRREYNKLLVSDARADHLTENLIEIAQNLNKEKPLELDRYIINYSKKEGILALSDWHFGMVTDNIWNQYNTEICKSRVAELCVKVKNYIKIHNLEKIHIILLGDEIHGAIHNGCRVASEENTSEQLMKVSEIIAELVNELSNEAKETFVYSTYGNHARTIQNKNDSIHSDNMEKIIPWWLNQRFANRDDIQIIDSEFYEFIKLNVCGYNIVATHGDLDNFKNLGVTVNTLFSKLYHENVDYTISGDKHHLEEFEQFGIESILVRSLCGADDYSNDHRLYSNAGQTLMIFNKEDGRECTYNIKLN